MVLVELYDSEPIENLVGFIVTKPRKVVFLGEKKKTERFEKIFSGVAKNRNIKTTFESRPVNRNFLQGMVDVLEDLVRSVNEENPKEEIVFDLCGGDDLMLVAAGIVYKAHSEIIQLQRYNVYTNKLIDCDENIISESQSKAEMSFEEYTRIHGGCVIASEYKSGRKSRWEITPELKKDVTEMWAICAQDYRKWNKNTGITAKAASDRNSSPLNIEVNLINEPSKTKEDYKSFTRMLLKAGMINNLKQKGNFCSFNFKNRSVQQCLLKSGVLLELYITIIAESIEENGQKIYNDVMMGAQIDWDGIKSPMSGIDVANEIDVVLMRGLRPIFISCKNGSFLPEELYKLSAVAKHFGGEYAKKVLVTNYLSANDNPARKDNCLQNKDEPNDKYMKRLKRQLLWNRAQEMDIKILCREAIKDEAAAAEALKNLYK